MSTLVSEAAVYLSDKMRRNRVGKVADSAVKYALGACFDLSGKSYSTEGMVFEVPAAQTTRSARSRFLFDTYELAERTLARKHLRPDAKVLELGGCIGVVACTVNQLLSDNRHHVVVEANPALIPVLTRNRDRNQCAFSIENGAVSEAPAYFSTAPEIESGRIAENGTPIPCLKIEQIEDRHAIRFDTLIMDIEGAESALLRENVSFLQRLNLLIVEFHPALIGDGEVSQLRAILASAGLRCVERGIDVEAYHQ